MELSDIDLTDSRNFVSSVPHEWFAFLRAQRPGVLARGAGRSGLLVRHEVRRLRERQPRLRELLLGQAQGHDHLGSPDEALEQLRLLMLNMDPPLHTRYRRLVNKGFTPRMVAQLEQKIHQTADDIIDAVIDKGEADFVTDMSAELPLQSSSPTCSACPRKTATTCSTGRTG